MIGHSGHTDSVGARGRFILLQECLLCYMRDSVYVPLLPATKDTSALKPTPRHTNQ